MLSELVQDILADFTDEEGEALVATEYVTRAAERALPLISSDLDVPYQLVHDDVTPAMPGDHRELWLVRSKILVCRFLRARSASRVSFSSGDKRMDRSREASNWAALEKDLTAEYSARVRKLNPAADDSVLSPETRPLVYSRGAQLAEME
jgi:hypothetical protein